jgi:hypothetical protein
MKRRIILMAAGMAGLLFASCLSFRAPPPPLYQAALDGNLDKVKKLVEGGADINAGAYSYTPLEGAASRGNLAIVEYLLSKGAHLKNSRPIRIWKRSIPTP